MEILRKRWIISCCIIVLMSIALAISLGMLTLDPEGTLSAQAEDRITRTIPTSGLRGSILDCNGIELAYNQKSYDVQFYRDPSKRNNTDRALHTEAMIKTIEIIERNGGKVISTFSIKRDTAGNYYYDWGVTNEDSKKARFKNWREAMSMNFTEETTAETAYLKLRQVWQIPDELSFDQAYKVMSIWQEVVMNSYRAYMPVTVAYNVSIKTISEIEQRAAELTGMRTAESTARVYPKNSVAAHVIGYLGRMTDADQIDKMNALGYQNDDLIGIAGIEQTMEQYLTGNTKERQGTKTVEVNKSAEITRVLSSTQPTDGNNVMLTLDLPLQQKVEEALANTIKTIKATQQQKLIDNRDKYMKIRSDLSTIKMAETGAIVVMDINNGNVLAIASYPSFDLNLFSGGISEKDYAALTAEEAHLPLFNKAISSKAAPGSIFKMVTGLAGLMEGSVSLTTKIDDNSPYTTFVSGETISAANAPSCWEHDISKHTQQDIEKALTNSCNYYFFTVTDRLGIQLLSKWASKFGLDSSTEIQLPGEAMGQIGGQKILYDNSKNHDNQFTGIPKLVYNQICGLLKKYLEQRNMEVNDGKVNTCAERLLKLVDGTKTNIGSDIRLIMREELGIPEGITASKFWHAEISSVLMELRWTPSLSIRTGIGQGVSLVTPIAVARYISAILNGGTVYNANLIKSVIDPNGKVIKQYESSVFGTLNADSRYLAAIKQGMAGVVSPEDGGTASSAFKDFEYTSEIGGKTGTAQIAANSSLNIDIENTSWFVAFTPFEKPEIAIVVYIPNGLSGTSSAPAIRDIVKFYLDRKNTKAAENVIKADGLTR